MIYKIKNVNFVVESYYRQFVSNEKLENIEEGDII